MYLRFIVLLSFLIGTNSIIRNDLQKEGLRGKVKRIHYYSNKDLINYSHVSEYNRSGYLMKTTYFNQVDSVWKKQRTLIRNYTYYKNESIKTIEHLDSVYEENNYAYLSGRIVEKYNNKGDLVSEIDYNTSYIEKESKEHNSNNIYHTKDTTIYNKKINEKTTFRYYRNGKLAHHWTSNYNNDGIIIKTKLYQKDSLYIEQVFNKKGFETLMIVYGDNKKDILHKYISKYDELDNLIEEVNSENRNKEVKKYNYSYKFDKQGNWIERNKFNQGVIIDTARRDVIYY